MIIKVFHLFLPVFKIYINFYLNFLIKNIDEPLKVFVALEVIHLGNFDNFQMEYELDVFLHMQWYDVRLDY